MAQHSFRTIPKLSKRDEIVDYAAEFIQHRGYNAFSYKDIARIALIQTASIHYYFPAKKDLGCAVVLAQVSKFGHFQKAIASESATRKLLAFLIMSGKCDTLNPIALIASFATDFNTIGPELRKNIRQLVRAIISWLSLTLADGHAQREFNFKDSPENRSLVIFMHLLGALQLTRLLGEGISRGVIRKILNGVRATEQRPADRHRGTECH